MEVNESNSRVPPKCNFEDALNLSGFGKYNFFMLTTCCCLILAMYIDIFGFSVVLPSAACDMGLTTTQQGMLSAVPLIGDNSTDVNDHDDDDEFSENSGVEL